MAKLVLSFVFLLISLHSNGIAAAAPKQSAVSTFPPRSLEFYMYIAVQNNTNSGGGVTYTAVQTAQPSQSQPFAFGAIHTFDNPLYSAAASNSTHLGRVQGWYGNAGLEILTLFLVQTFSFSGSPSGTFSLVGIDVATDNVKYGAIVGGTGDFSYARGVAKQSLVSTQTLNQQTVSWFHYVVDLKY